jgi:hypothetical protein
MSMTLDLNPAILEAVKPECATRLFGLRGGQIKVPDFDPDHLMFHVVIAPDGTRQLRAVTPQEAGGRIPGNPYDLLARVRRQCADFPLRFPRQHTDSQGHAWDLVCTGTLTVADAKRFAERGLGLVSAGAPLRRDRLAAWLAQEFGVAVQDCLRAELGKRSFEDLREKNVLPAEWWSRQFAPGLERFGLQLADLGVRWESADSTWAEQAERSRQTQAQLSKQVEAEDRQRLEQARREAELTQCLAEIDAAEIDRKSDLKIKHMASQAQLEQVEEEFKRRRLEAEQKYREAQLAGEMRLQDLQREAEKRALEHEVKAASERAKIAELERQNAEPAVRQAREDLQRAQEQCRQAERSYQAQAQFLGDLKGELKRLFSGFTPKVLTDLLGQNQTASYNAASSIASHGLSAQHLQAMGIDTHLNFIERLQDSTVQVRKNNLKRKLYPARDIVTGPARDMEFDTLLFREKVDFEFASPRPGYVTIINPGTSGKFWLHAPNAYRPMARIEGGRTYEVPGPELLPEDKLKAAGLDYYENGPAGWEYIAVIVSDEPLIEAAVAGRSSDKAPVIELSPTELQAALDRLERMGRDHWAAGVAKFRVEPV